MKSIKIKVCYDSKRSPSVVVKRMPNGLCYQDGVVEIPDNLEIAESMTDEMLVGYEENYYPLEDLLFYSDKTEMVYLRTPWDDNNSLGYIPLKTKLYDGTHFC